MRGDHKEGLGGVSEDELVQLLKTGRNDTSVVFASMADVVTFIRSSWGNQAKPVKTTEVKKYKRLISEKEIAEQAKP